MKKTILSLFCLSFVLAANSEDTTTTTTTTTTQSTVVAAPVDEDKNPLSMSYYVYASSDLTASGLSGEHSFTASYSLTKTDSLSVTLSQGLDYTSNTVEGAASFSDPMIQYKRSLGKILNDISASARVRYYYPATEKSKNKHVIYTRADFSKKLSDQWSMGYQVKPVYYHYTSDDSSGKKYFSLYNQVSVSYKISDKLSTYAYTAYTANFNKAKSTETKAPVESNEGEETKKEEAAEFFSSETSLSLAGGMSYGLTKKVSMDVETGTSRKMHTEDTLLSKSNIYYFVGFNYSF